MAKKQKETKTNVMRMLDAAKVAYTPYAYDASDGAIDGVAVARKLGQDPASVFKTLVTQGASKNYFVFVIPVEKELDLKKAARAVGEKSVAMLHVADLLKVTGYVRGGCSPLGMKKPFVTVLDESCLAQPLMAVSAGHIGFQVQLAPGDLVKLAKATTADVTQGDLA
ncbi:Cys-tRNA(Pro) deacylase [uncultured Ruthenibacterium sp.]|uniref:Cys-tRNA(Pro) deacylase n=1 Tax=uncultured Ruthenibacterium sp. TaxID=1905347 RepID=UPI00349E6489